MPTTKKPLAQPAPRVPPAKVKRDAQTLAALAKRPPAKRGAVK